MHFHDHLIGKSLFLRCQRRYFNHTLDRSHHPNDMVARDLFDSLASLEIFRLFIETAMYCSVCEQYIV